MRVDEGGREHEALARDHAVAVGVEPDPDRGDHSSVDADIEERVDPLGRVEDARAAYDEVVCPAPADEDHATPTTVSTATGPLVSRS